MLGEPALLASHGRGDAQRIALLAQQRVAAVAGTDAPDGALFREMGNKTAIWGQIAERVQAWNPIVRACLDAIQRHLAHARHDAHVGNDIRAIGDLDADLGIGRTGRTHQVGDDVHGAAAHRLVEQGTNALFGIGGAHPVVGRARVLGILRADEGEVFGTRDVLRIRAVKKAVRQALLIQAKERAI